jgi:hypothetical protein
MKGKPSSVKRQGCFVPILALASATLLFAAGVRAADAAASIGKWAGTTQARCGTLTTDHSRCGAVQNITLTLMQEGAKVTGSYTCAYGNQNCRGMQTTGTIVQGSLKGAQLELVIVTPDRSTCRYNGLLQEDTGKGSYYCKGGSQLDERGAWRVKRAE